LDTANRDFKTINQVDIIVRIVCPYI